MFAREASARTMICTDPRRHVKGEEFRATAGESGSRHDAFATAEPSTLSQGSTVAPEARGLVLIGTVSVAKRLAIYGRGPQPGSAGPANALGGLAISAAGAATNPSAPAR